MSWVVVRFIIIGPAAGCLGFLLADQLLSAMHIAKSALSEPATFSALPVTVVMLWLYGAALLAYPFGGIPAAVAGCLYNLLLKHRAKPNFKVLGRLFIGGLLGIASAGLFGAMFFHPPYFSDLARWATAGIFGGAASAAAIGDNLHATIRRHAGGTP